MAQRIMYKKNRSKVKGVMYKNTGSYNNTVNGKTYVPQGEKDREEEK